ncbi:tyrosine-type recombinase/integrase [Nocardia sp. NPDC003999]
MCEHREVAKARTRRTPKEAAEIESKYEAGVSMARLKAEHHMAKRMVAKGLSATGVTISPRGGQHHRGIDSADNVLYTRRCIKASIPHDDDGNPTGPATFPRVTAHQLRHTAASLMIASGAHVKTVQRQLGHKTATMTLDNYGHLFEDDLDDVADRMSEGLRAAAQKCGQIVGTAPEDTSVAV